MNQPLPLAVFSWYGFILPLTERLERIQQAGFDGTMLWWEDESLFGKEKKKEFPGLARRIGLDVVNIHVPYEDCNLFWSQSQQDRERIGDKYRSWIDDCADLQIQQMVIHLTEGTEPPPFSFSGVKTLEWLVFYAEENRVVLAVENTRRPEYVAQTLREIPSPYFGFCYDSSHDWIQGQSQGHLLVELKERLVATHFSDNNGLEDQHRIPGQGIVDWSKIMRAFPRETYSGALAFEIFANPEESKDSPARFLSKAHQKAREIREMMEIKCVGTQSS